MYSIVCTHFRVSLLLTENPLATHAYTEILQRTGNSAAHKQPHENIREHVRLMLIKF